MKNLRLLRKNNGLTQKDIANLLKVAVSTVSAWENDVYQIDFDNLIKLADYYHVSLDVLLDRKEITIFDDARIPSQRSISPDDAELLEDFNSLSPAGKAKVRGYIEGLKSAPEYNKINKYPHNIA